MTDGHKPVIGHHGQEEAIQYYKEQGNIHLCDAAFIGDKLALCQDVHQHLLDSDEGRPDVHQGQAGEEVHGCMKVR